jgi:hypothetical protein
MATVRLQIRRGTASQWTSANPILAAGEMGVETDTRKVKIGDGTTGWTSLNYIAADNPEISEIAQDAIDQALTAGTGILKSYNDGSNTITVSVDTSVIATKAELAEVAQDSIDQALTAGTGITKNYDDAANTLTVSVDTSVIADKTYADTKLALAGGTMSGAISMGSNKVTNMADPDSNQDAATKKYVDDEITNLGNNLNNSIDDYIPLSEKGTLGGVATLDANVLVPLSQLTHATDYVDNEISAHNGESQNVHGIADTASLVTTSGTQSLTNKTIVSPVITTPTGILKADIGLGNVDNTSDASKPISTATQAALDLLSNQLDAAVAGIHVKESVRVVSVSNITLSGTQTVDGISLAVGDRILVAGQTDATTNGIYVVASGAWSRATDFDETSESKEGDFVFVVEGTLNGNHGYVLISEGSGANESIIFGTDSLNFTKFTGANLTTAGFGLTKTEDVMAVDTAAIATVTYVGTALDALETTIDATKANLNGGATFTGTIVLPQSTSIGDVSATEIGYVNGVTSAIQTQLDSKANLDGGATFTGTVVLPATTSIDIVSGTEISYLNGATSNIQQQIDEKAPLAGAVFTGVISLPQTTSIGGVSDTEIQYLDGVTASIQDQLDLKSPSANPTFTGTVVLPGTTSIGDVSATEIGYVNGVTSSIQNQIDTKASNTDLTNHNNDTTNVHGIADTDALATKIYADDAVSTHNSDTTNVHGITNTAALVTLTGAQTLTGKTLSAADNSITINASDIVDVTATATELNYVDGVTSSIQTQLDSKASSTDLTNHNNDTTGVHGIANTADLVTLMGQETLENKTLKATLVDAGNNISFLGTNPVSVSNNDGAFSVSGDLEASGNFKVDGWIKASDTSGIIDLNGDVTVQNNLTVEGDLTVNGTNFSASATSIVIEDNIVQLAHQNPGNTVDLGIVVGYDGGLGPLHAGLVRDVSANTWKLFQGVTTEPTTTVDFTQGGLDNLEVQGLTTTNITIGSLTQGTVSANDLLQLSGVTSPVQTQLDAKAPTASPTFTGTVVLPSTTSVGSVSSTELGYLDGVTSAIQTQLNAKAPTASPTFTGTVTVAASGIAFTDGTQTKEGVPSRTTITPVTAAYDLSTGGLALRDQMIEISHTGGTAVNVTVPTDATTNFPIGTSIDLLRTNTGGVQIVGASGVTVNATPGAYLRARWSSATLFKRAANTWVLMGDLASS